jgi:hypothetical protein
MRVGVVSSSTLFETGRMDAGFLLRYEANKELVVELVEKYTVGELARLALDLPYDRDSAKYIMPGNQDGTEHYFRQWVERRPNLPADDQDRAKRDLATYVAVAAKTARERLEAEIRELRVKADEKKDLLNAVTATAGKRKAVGFHRLMEGNPGG